MPSGLVRRRLGVAFAVLGLLVLAAPAAADDDEDDQPRQDILFSSDREAAGLSLDIYAMRPDGTDIIRLTETAGFWNNGPDWSPERRTHRLLPMPFRCPPAHRRM